MAKGVPILLDDLTPSFTKGSRPSASIEEVKHLTDVQSSGSVDARHGDIVFYEDQPRIITSNAASMR
eukprot:4762332-Heterocapsa_arctica.AAC.1